MDKIMFRSIALVDDDRNILTSISIALEADGFEVNTYVDRTDAIRGLAQKPADLAILDIKMPRMDGVELLLKIRETSSIPVIFLTSKDDEIDELGNMLNDMTEALWRRMEAIERFAADVSHEIKNPLTSLRSAIGTMASLDSP